MAWEKIVSVPSLKAAQVQAKTWKPRADKVKIVKTADGWYGVWALNPSELARIVFGLNPRR